MKRTKWLMGLWTLASIGAPASAIEEVLVTAQKTLQSQSQVSFSVQALDTETLEVLRIERADDILRHFANVGTNASNDVNAGFSIRGVGTNNFHGNVSRAVGVYLDEVAVNSPYAGVLAVFDQERVELLRGPQNILFGRNSMGGAVHYLSAAPQMSAPLSGHLQADVGERSLRQIKGALAASVGETFAWRAALFAREQDGRFENQAPGFEGQALGQTQRYAGRLQGLWEPDPDTQWLINLHHNENGGTGLGHRVVGLRDENAPGMPCDADDVAAGADFKRTVPCATASGLNSSGEPWRQLYDVSPKRQDIRLDGGFLRFDRSMGRTDFRWLSSLEVTDVAFTEDLGGDQVLRFVPNQDAEFLQSSHEFRFSGRMHNTLQWLAGAQYFSEDLQQATVVRRNIIGNGADITSYNILDQQEREFAVFAQTEWALSARSEIITGARWMLNRKEADSTFGVISTPQATVPSDQFLGLPFVQANQGNPPGACPPSVGGIPCSMTFEDLEQSLARWLFDVRYRYAFSDEDSAYVRLANGVKSGGFDTRALAAFQGSADAPVAPESLDSIEVGAKTWWRDRTLKVDAAVFYYLWEDLQTFDVIDGIPGFMNVPEVTLYGAELESAWQLASDTTLWLALGWLDATVTDAGNLSNVDEGHALQNAPPWSGSLRLQQGLPTSLGRWVFDLEYYHSAEQVDGLNFESDPYTTREAYGLVNASVALQAREDWELKLWAENVMEEQYCLQKAYLDTPGSASPRDLSAVLTCNPNPGERQLGLSFHYQW